MRGEHPRGEVGAGRAHPGRAAVGGDAGSWDLICQNDAGGLSESMSVARANASW